MGPERQPKYGNDLFSSANQPILLVKTFYFAVLIGHEMNTGSFFTNSHMTK